MMIHDRGEYGVCTGPYSEGRHIPRSLTQEYFFICLAVSLEHDLILCWERVATCETSDSSRILSKLASEVWTLFQRSPLTHALSIEYFEGKFVIFEYLAFIVQVLSRFCFLTEFYGGDLL